MTDRHIGRASNTTPSTPSAVPRATANERPFRNLCPEAGLRDGMSDADFWAHVFRQPDQWVDDDGLDLDQTTNQDKPCPLCGELGACGYDADGRPLLHALDGEDE